MSSTTVTEGVTLSLEISETTYQMLLEELAGDQRLSFDGVAEHAIRAWVEGRRNQRRMMTKLMLGAAA